jgi:hypothetical protein
MASPLGSCVVVPVGLKVNSVCQQGKPRTFARGFTDRLDFSDVDSSRSELGAGAPPDGPARAEPDAPPGGGILNSACACVFGFAKERDAGNRR